MSPEFSIEGMPNQDIPADRDFQRTGITNTIPIKGQGENQVPFRVTENELIAGCIKNDRLCQSELYKRYFSMMSALAMRYCRSEEDAVQAVNYGFLKVLQNIARYKGEFALATWIRTILVNHLIDEYRKSIKEIQNIRIDDVDIPEAATELNLAEYHFSDQQLRQMLNQLPDATRTVFNLFAMEGYKHTEISKIMGITEGTSKWHVSEARKRLAEMLTQSTGEKYNKKGTRI